jgi:hypothetical protein
MVILPAVGEIPHSVTAAPYYIVAVVDVGNTKYSLLLLIV